jgi:hypothetical protein
MTLGRLLLRLSLLGTLVVVPCSNSFAQSTDSAVVAPTPVPEAPAAPEVPAEPQAVAAPAAGNAMNPNLSVIAWLQAHAGSPRVLAPAFQEKEAEIGLQSVVDPYARADFFLSASDDGLSLEEGYLTLTQLPAGLGLKLGKFRNKLGKFNQTHAGETPFADRPLVASEFFGEEGLSSTGLSGSYLVPNPLDAYINLEAEVTTPPPAADGGIFSRQSDRNALQYLGRVTWFTDLSDATSLNLSVTGANAPLSEALEPEFLTAGNRTMVWGGEITVRWKNPRRAIYKSLVWQTEGYLARPQARELILDSSLKPIDQTLSRKGLFSYVDYQFDRRFHTGFRFDIVQSLDPDFRLITIPKETGELVFLTFQPSEFMLFSTQVRHVHNFAGGEDWNEFAKLTFNIGPHGAHPF